MLILVSGSTRSVSVLAGAWTDALGHLITPANRNGMRSLLSTGLRWAVDNGAFSGFDPVAFRRLVGRVAGKPRLLWVACPDVVADCLGTLELFREWGPELRSAGVPVAFVLQDGQERHELPAADAYFVGGSTRWKLSQAAGDVGAEAKRRGAWLHMGRVNSRKRLETAVSMGCDSVDGSSLSMFGDKYIHKFLRWAAELTAEARLF